MYDENSFRRRTDLHLKIHTQSDKRRNKEINTKVSNRQGNR